MINDDRRAGTCVHSIFTIKFRSALLISAWDRYCLKWSSNMPRLSYGNLHSAINIHQSMDYLFVFKNTQDISLNVWNNVRRINYKTSFFWRPFHPQQCLTLEKKIKGCRPWKVQPQKAGYQTQTQTIPCGICCGQTGIETGFPLNTVIFLLRFHSTNDLYSFSHLTRIYIDLSIYAFIK
jgi:hypothetical protein